MTIGILFERGFYEYLIPFLFTVFFIVFIWGTFSYVIAGGPDEHAKEKGKSVLMYALLGFIATIVLWGIGNIIKSVLP